MSLACRKPKELGYAQELWTTHLLAGYARRSLPPGPSVYVVGLRVTGLVITTIPAIVLRPEPPTTGAEYQSDRPQWSVDGYGVGKDHREE